MQDVNLASSTLSGSLTIHNLTPNNPELTTYFDGEIIGSHFGFLTPEPNWSTTDEGDLAHWERFGAPFRAVKGELCRPDLTIRGGERGDRGTVFMRWKEKFLMPDHKVTSVAGASFAGQLSLSSREGVS
jgi:glucose-induced degradation protein 4